jgi:ABC-type multidrug transport system fused ATPase/permease subunit
MNLLTVLFKYFYKEEKFNIILVVILSLLTNVLKINIISYITANIIKSIQNNNIKYAYEYYKYLIFIIVVFIILLFFFRKGQNSLLTKIKNWGRLFLIKNIYYNSNENLSNSTNYTKLGYPLLRITNSLHYIVSMCLNKLVPNISLILIIFLFFVYKDYKIALIFLIGNIIFFTYLYNSYFKLSEKHNILEKHSVENESIINENLNNFDKIILRGKKNEEINILDNNTDNLYKLGYKFNELANHSLLICNIIIYSTLIIIIGYLIYLYFKKAISPVIFITFITILLLYRDLILSSIEEMPVYIEFVSRAVIITELFDKKIFLNLLEPNNKKKSNKLSSQELNNIKFNNIEFKNVHFKYDSESIKLFDDLNMKINIKNKIIGLTGLSGNGKSTLIKLLLKLYPYEGTILLDNIDVNSIDTNYLRKKIIYIDQSSNLFDKKIIENINYGINIDDENEMILSKKYFNEIMKNSKIKELYDNIDFESKNAGFNGSNLSGGQRQVINLINGLITPSIITVLDEPTNALDPNLKKEVIKIIKEFKKYNKCIIIITHDKDLYEIFDENIVL